MNDSNNDSSLSVESGEYYRDALRWYSTLHHSPISERAILIIIAVTAGIVTLMTVLSLFVLLPLTDTKTMVVRVPESIDRVARVKQLLDNPRQDPNQAVLDWFVGDFVGVRESYDINKQERLHRRVWVLSSPEVYGEYVALYKSAKSPTLLFERHTKRTVEVRNMVITSSDVLGRLEGSPAESVDAKARVNFEVTELSSTEERKIAWVADISFRYSKIHVDQITGEMTPMQFKVTGYESKQLGLE